MTTAPDLTLYNTLTRSKELFAPIDPADVRMYVCGPTVYDAAHIGNARPIIVFDLLFRLLRHRYGASHVTYVRNVTDVDDKINARAFERWTRKRPLTEEIRALTDGTLAEFEVDVAKLGVLPPTHQPRATDFICSPDKTLDMVEIIRRLVDRGHAYEAKGHVLFHVPSMPDYGQLSRRPRDELIAGARVEVAPWKRDPADFVLWKPSDRETEPGWESPWGYGRPGWHIECSAMAGTLLGDVFDIHGGGLDLIFPHHENEIAQSRCALGTPSLAQVWMHNGFLQVEGEKMSKSLGNFVTLREIVAGRTFGGSSWHGAVVKLAMLETHYRQPIDFSVDRLVSARNTLRAWNMAASGAENYASFPPSDGVWSCLFDDLNTPAAIAELHRLVKRVGVTLPERIEAAKSSGRNWEHDVKTLAATLDLLGLRDSPDVIFGYGFEVLSGPAEADVRPLLDARASARAAKDWAESDRLRNDLLAMGVLLQDNKDGTTTWELKR